MRRDWLVYPQDRNNKFHCRFALGLHAGWKDCCAEAAIRWNQLWRRPALPVAAGLLLGGNLATHAMGRTFLVFLVLTVFSVSAWLFWQKSLHWPRLLLIASCLILGGLRFSWSYGQAELFSARHPDGFYTGEVKVIQMLTSSSVESDRVIAIVSAPGGVRLALSGNESVIRPNAVLWIQGYLVKPPRAANPGGFDRQAWLWRQGVLQELDASRGRINVIEPGGENWPVQLAAWLRDRLEKNLITMVGENEARLLLSLLIGSTKKLSLETEYFFRQAGLSHLTAVSGANISFWLTPLTQLVRRIRVRRNVRQFLLLGCLIGFGFLTGWQISVSRAIVMTGLFLLGRLMHRKSDALNALGISVLIFFVISPFALLSFGFWLSVLATLGLLAGGPAIALSLVRRWPSVPPGLLHFIGVNLAVQILVVPVSAIVSRQVMIIGLLANVPALLLVEGITIVGLVIMAGGAVLRLGLAAAGVFGVSGFSADTVVGKFLQVAGCPLSIALNSLDKIAKFFGRLDMGRWPVVRLNLMLMAAAILCLLPLLWRGKSHVRSNMIRIGLGLLLAGMLWQMLKTPLMPNDLVWFFSVGQGDSTLIQMHTGQVILIDAGKPDSGWKIILPALDALGIRRIDALILTHGHLDHAGGAGELLQSGRVDQLVVPDTTGMGAIHSISSISSGGQDDMTTELIEQADHLRVPWQKIGYSQHIQINKQDQLTVLHPIFPTAKELELKNLNEWALHFRLELSGRSLLLMSDCTPEVEEALLSDPEIVNNDILKVAHHGSRFTTLATYLEKVQPAYAVISVGPNQYGHPASELLDRLVERNVQTLRTDLNGAILIELAQGHLYANSYWKDYHGQGS